MSALPFKQIDVFGKANDGFSSLHVRSFGALLASPKIWYAAAVTPRSQRA